MEKQRWIILGLAGLALLFVLACVISFGNGDDGDTAVQQTLQAIQQTQTAAASVAQGQVPPAGQETTPESPTPAQQQSPTPTITPNPTPCNVSRMVSETVPDGSSFDANETFTKSWTIRNVGSCQWSENYALVFEDGTSMGGETQKVNSIIKPGETKTFTLNLKAPASNGSYKGVWRLKSDAGEKLGWYSVNIFVGPTPAPFAVTSVTFYMPHISIDTGCPNNINVKAEITSSAAGTVTYKWQDSAGGSIGHLHRSRQEDRGLQC